MPYTRIVILVCAIGGLVSGCSVYMPNKFPHIVDVYPASFGDQSSRRYLDHEGVAFQSAPYVIRFYDDGWLLRVAAKYPVSGRVHSCARSDDGKQYLRDDGRVQDGAFENVSLIYVGENMLTISSARRVLQGDKTEIRGRIIYEYPFTLIRDRDNSICFTLSGGVFWGFGSFSRTVNIGGYIR